MKQREQEHRDTNGLWHADMIGQTDWQSSNRIDKRAAVGVFDDFDGVAARARRVAGPLPQAILPQQEAALNPYPMNAEGCSCDLC